VKQACRHLWIVFLHQYQYMTGNIETVAPASLRIDGERALVISAVQVAKGPHTLSSGDGIV
jgi:hypothetical protein